MAPESLRRIIVDGDPQVLVKEAESWAEKLAEQQTTGSQLRAIFDEVRQIEALSIKRSEEAWRRLHLLKPKIAYRAKRAGGGLARLVQDVLTPSLDLVTADKNELPVRFQRFAEFLEAILAYYVAKTRR